MSDLAPIQARVDSEETGLIPIPVLDALSAAVGAARDLQKVGVTNCLITAATSELGGCGKCSRCAMNTAIDQLDEVMALWKRGELFTVRQPNTTGEPV